MLLRCAVSRGVNARLRYDWRTPIACGWATKMGSHAATASGASTVPCSGTSSARFRATPYSAGGTLRSGGPRATEFVHSRVPRSEEHTSELQSLMRISYAVFCLKKKILKQHKEQQID